VVGSNQEAIYAFAQRLEEFLRIDPEISPYLVDLGNDRGQTQRVLQFKVKADRAQEYGLDNSAVASVAASVLDGYYVGKYRATDEEIDFKLGISSHYLNSPVDALNIPVLEHPSGAIRLMELVDLETRQESAFINRYKGERAVTVLANIRPGAPISTPVVVNRVKQFYAQNQDQYPGIALTFGGAHEATQRSYLSLTYAFALAILIMYMILATQFQSYVQPLIILSSVVFALIGVIFGSVITQSLFTVNSFIAIVGLTGVVVNNSIIMIDFMNRSYQEGKSRNEAITHAIHVRLRPILLTTLTTTLGLLPMALGIPSYSLVWGAMASTFVTGLSVATVLTLFLVPVQWDLLQEAKERWGHAHAPIK
jgi:multidrug efflux pump subunit AcrB